MAAKRTVLALLAGGAAVVASAALAAPAAAPAHASVLIRHQLRGCHGWSVNGGKFAASQTVALRRGGTVTITNDDVMAHTLVELRGPVVRMKSLMGAMNMNMGMHGMEGPGAMGHMGARIQVTFRSAGTYRFTTKAGEDYMKGMKTIGEDNVLRLTLRVVNG
jgi:plastocyanin